MEAIEQRRVQGLFLDYDGTISPLNVPRQESRVSKETDTILHRIKQLIPVVIITTKDLSFILPRAPFANAWCAIGGLEMKIGDRVTKDPRVLPALPYISLALEYAKHRGDNHLFIEEKHDSTTQTVAFCVDWRYSRDLREAETRAIEVIDYCQTLPLDVVKYEGQPFFDVYPYRIDKGKALAELKRNFGLQGGVMYLGDSKVDNAAFRIADIGIGVLHEGTTSELECNYHVKFKDVARFLKHLMGNRLVFDSGFPEIKASRGGQWND